MPRSRRTLSDADYQRLAEFRYGLRRFLHWSAQQARTVGITPTQHQLLLAVRASRDGRGPTVSEIADVLLIRHHSAVELIDRVQNAGLITRERDPDNHAVVHLRLTERGAETLSGLSELHLRELAQLAPTMQALFGALSDSEAADLTLLR